MKRQVSKKKNSPSDKKNCTLLWQHWEKRKRISAYIAISLSLVFGSFFLLSEEQLPLLTVGRGMLPMWAAPDILSPLSRDADLVLTLPRENFLDLDLSFEPLLALPTASCLSITLGSDVLLVRSFLTFLINSGVSCSGTEYEMWDCAMKGIKRYVFT